MGIACGCGLVGVRLCGESRSMSRRDRVLTKRCAESNASSACIYQRNSCVLRRESSPGRRSIVPSSEVEATQVTRLSIDILILTIDDLDLQMEGSSPSAKSTKGEKEAKLLDCVPHKRPRTHESPHSTFNIQVAKIFCE